MSQGAILSAKPACVCRLCDAAAPAGQPQAPSVSAAGTRVRTASAASWIRIMPFRPPAAPGTWKVSTLFVNSIITRWMLRRRAVINRYGFNSDGIDAVGQRLAAYRRSRWALPPGYGPLLTTARQDCCWLCRGAAAGAGHCAIDRILTLRHRYSAPAAHIRNIEQHSSPVHVGTSEW